MNRRLVISILIIILAHPLTMGQAETYTVSKASFSMDDYDEFCPVFYRDGLVYTSNMGASSFFNYLGSENKGVFNIFYVRKKEGDEKWSDPELLSKKLSTRYNDGPAAFSKNHDTIFYSRNLHVEGKLKNNSNVRNRLGIFFSTIDNDDWGNIREMRINNTWYNVTTPFLSPDGNKLYFASDNPDGYGGMDLYYIKWKGNYWGGDPVNLGPDINTAGNEAYPFINRSGELMFSSDGHGGMGGKDIFFSRKSGDEWLPVVHIDAPINSEHDDFGIITGPLMNEGYFSSDRDGSVDVYHFKTLLPQIFYTNNQKENQYCFVFNDPGSIEIDNSLLTRRWIFSDGDTLSGTEVMHCFPGPGDYDISLDLVDRASGSLYSSKLNFRLTLEDFEQPYIDSPDAAVKGEVLQFDAKKSYLPGYEILEYSWDFGDGERAGGSDTSHAFSQSGEYQVNLGLTVRSVNTGDILRTGISKTIEIFDGQEQKNEFERKQESMTPDLVNVFDYSGTTVDIKYSAEEDLVKGAVFRVELFSSERRLSLTDRIFRDVPPKYRIDEEQDEETGSYSYFVEWQMRLMDTYPAYRELQSLGYDDLLVKTEVLTEPAERDLYNLIRIYGVSADRCFDNSNMLTSHALIMLDQVVNYLNKYPAVKLEVGVHTDSTGAPAATNLNISQVRAGALVSYLVNRGVRADRLIARGYGEMKPIAPNYLEDDRKLNRRVEFRIVGR